MFILKTGKYRILRENNHQMFASWGWKISVAQKFLLQYFAHKKKEMLYIYVYLGKKKFYCTPMTSLTLETKEQTQ